MGINQVNRKGDQPIQRLSHVHVPSAVAVTRLPDIGSSSRQTNASSKSVWDIFNVFFKEGKKETENNLRNLKKNVLLGKNESAENWIRDDN